MHVQYCVRIVASGTLTADHTYEINCKLYACIISNAAALLDEDTEHLTSETAVSCIKQ
jgi:hypothetical protein